MKHTYSLQIIVRILVLCLFLQNCSGFSNAPLNSAKEFNIQDLLDQEFTAEGGHLVTFYQEQEEIKATVQVTPLDEKDKIYNEVNVVVEKGVELSSLAKLDRKMQQKRIQIQFSEEQKSKPKSVVIHKPWLMGGMKEVIIFCGNPGVGKSALCNSIFQSSKPIFNSGVSILTGMTTNKQEYLHEGKLYVDTPGLADAKTRKKAGKAITEALKHNGNYKIAFVITLEGGRLSPEDVATIETVCEAIQVPFEYGLIFNKVTPGIRKKIINMGVESYVNKYGIGLDNNINNLTEQFILNLIQLGLSDGFLEVFTKKPSSVTMLTRENHMEDEEGEYFSANSPNMKNLLNFLDKLKATEIHESNIIPLDTTDYKKKIEEQEKKNKKLEGELNSIKEENRRQIRDLDAQISRLNEELAKKGEGFWSKVGNFLGDVGSAIVVSIAKSIFHRPGPTCDSHPGGTQNCNLLV
ncbi:MAG: GTPase [Candidatus Amoebophilus sp.]